jgi:hypothetical protein
MPCPHEAGKAEGHEPAETERRPTLALSPPQNRRVQIGEALREKGMDEHALAGALVGVVGTLTRNTDETGNVERLLVDVLKECSRHLTAPEQDPRDDSSVFVHMIHNVPRPQRLPKSVPVPAAILDVPLLPD